MKYQGTSKQNRANARGKEPVPVVDGRHDHEPGTMIEEEMKGTSKSGKNRFSLAVSESPTFRWLLRQGCYYLSLAIVTNMVHNDCFQL